MIDFRTATYDELDQHSMEQLVFDGGAVSPVLRGHLFVEGILEELLRRSFKNPAAILGRGSLTFDIKIDLGRALGVLSEQHASLFRALNRLRNRYAHEPGYEVSLKELSSLKYHWADIQDKAYKAAATRGPDEAARIAIIFLCWEALSLIKTPTAEN